MEHPPNTQRVYLVSSDVQLRSPRSTGNEMRRERAEQRDGDHGPTMSSQDMPG
jgi:hypothetical protein